ncbi:unnamed protein product, partial [Protopolystoma xenopodis]
MCRFISLFYVDPRSVAACPRRQSCRRYGGPGKPDQMRQIPVHFRTWEVQTQRLPALVVPSSRSPPPPRPQRSRDVNETRTRLQARLGRQTCSLGPFQTFIIPPLLQQTCCSLSSSSSSSSSSHLRNAIEPHQPVSEMATPLPHYSDSSPLQFI